MNETTAVFWVAFLFMLRFGLPLMIVLGGGYVWNYWLDSQARRGKAV